MKWVKNVYRKYMLGAEANRLPIKTYGILGSKIKAPRNLLEAMTALDVILPKDEKQYILERDEDSASAVCHHSLGRWMRNNWGLWRGNSKLFKWFVSQGISHPDDMSGIILTSYWRFNHNQPIKLREQIKVYLHYWQALTETENK